MANTSLPLPAPLVGTDTGYTQTLPRAMSAAQLFGGAKELVIDHLGEIYRLRITKNNKLILTK